jgi:hypothetical protein
MATLLSGVEPVSIGKLLPNGKDWGFLNPKNHTIMQDLCDSWADIDDPVKFGVPNRILNPCYRRERALS